VASASEGSASGRATTGPEAAFRFDPALFQVMPAPGPNDWLAGPGRYEREQSFDEYVKSRPPGRTRTRTVIVFQPLGGFSSADTALLEKVRRYCEIYFDTPARVERPIPLPARGARSRSLGERAWKQYLTGAILNDILRPRLPPDAICYLGVTMEDLYPREDWNFVFGQASLHNRVGVYSFARYRPEFYGERAGPDAERLLLKRSIKVMVHEAGHMFGLAHCRRYRCVQNGSNHLAESDARPVFLCPDCLRKLHWRLGFDVVSRYRKMLGFWQENGFPDEARWLERRLASLGEAAGTGGQETGRGT